MVHTPTNPILAYKEKRKILWNDVAKQTGLTRHQINRLAHFAPEDFLSVSMYTAIRLQRGCGINLLAWLLAHFDTQLVPNPYGHD